jgi:hypothetical protein
LTSTRCTGWHSDVRRFADRFNAIVLMTMRPCSITSSPFMVAIFAPSSTFTPVGLSACIRKPISSPRSGFGAAFIRSGASLPRERIFQLTGEQFIAQRKMKLAAIADQCRY